MQYDIAGTGSMVVDAIMNAARIIGAEEKALLLPHSDGAVVRRLVGGVALNHLGWARILGMRVAVFGKQADDEAGRFLRAGMDRLGIAQHLDLSGGASSMAQLFVDSEGARAIYMARGATAELTPEEIDAVHADVIASAHIVTSEVSQVPLATVRRVFELARAAGRTTVLDLDVGLVDAVPALGTLEQLHACLELADIIKPSLAAVAGIVDASGAEEVAAALAKRYGAKVVAVTDGEAGSVVWADGECVRVSAPSVNVRDTTGAGDAFLGGFIAGIRHGLDWTNCARLGNASGAACCERLGAFPDAVCRDRVAALYAELGGSSLVLDEPVAGAAATADALEGFLETASTEIAGVCADLDREAIRAVAAGISAAQSQGGRVHVTGIGKSAHVAQYAAALLSSVGTPAYYLHGTEAIHGSVGQLCPNDVVIAMSNSGTTVELLACVDGARGMDARIVAVTADPASPLADASDWVIRCAVGAEGGPLDLAPRNSVLAQTLVLAALSVELQQQSGLDRTDYNRRHPAGALGARSGSIKD